MEILLARAGFRTWIFLRVFRVRSNAERTNNPDGNSNTIGWVFSTCKLLDDSTSPTILEHSGPPLRDNGRKPYAREEKSLSVHRTSARRASYLAKGPEDLLARPPRRRMRRYDRHSLARRNNRRARFWGDASPRGRGGVVPEDWTALALVAGTYDFLPRWCRTSLVPDRSDRLSSLTVN